MIFTTKVVISFLATLAALGAAGGVVYALDKNSLSEEETHKITGINPNLSDGRICEKWESSSADNTNMICKKLSIPKEETRRRVIENHNINGRDELKLHKDFVHLGEHVLGQAKEKFNNFSTSKK